MARKSRTRAISSSPIPPVFPSLPANSSFNRNKLGHHTISTSPSTPFPPRASRQPRSRSQISWQPYQDAQNQRHALPNQKQTPEDRASSSPWSVTQRNNAQRLEVRCRQFKAYLLKAVEEWFPGSQDGDEEGNVDADSRGRADGDEDAVEMDWQAEGTIRILYTEARRESAGCYCWNAEVAKTLLQSEENLGLDFGWDMRRANWREDRETGDKRAYASAYANLNGGWEAITPPTSPGIDFMVETGMRRGLSRGGN